MVSNHLAVEDVCQFVGSHAYASVGDREFHVVGSFGGGHGDAAPFGCKLAGVIGQRVEHEEGQYAVGLDHGLGGRYLQADALHLETFLAADNHVEQGLQREALDMEVQLPLPQLYPLCEQLVVGLYLVDKFEYVLTVAPAVDGIDHTVDERQQRIDKRNLGALLQVTALAFFHMAAADGQLLAALLYLLFQRVVIATPTSQPPEEHQQQHQQQDGSHDGQQNPVEMVDGIAQLSGTGLQLAVLSRLLLQVEIKVAVLVAVGFVVDSGVGHAQLLIDAGHEVGRLHYGGIGQRLVQIVECRLIVANGSAAGGQRAIGTRRLIDVAIVLEHLQRLSGQADGHVTVSATIGTDQRQGHVAAFGGGNDMLGYTLQGIGHEVGIVATQGYLVTAQQMVHLLTVNLLGAAFGNDTSGADVVQIVQKLRRIALDGFGVDGFQRLCRLLLQAYIIIIGGGDNGQLRLAVEQSPPLAVVEYMALFVDAAQGGKGFLAVVVKILVARLSLAESHLLHIAYKQLQLVVGLLWYQVQQIFRRLIVHLGHVGEGQVVMRLGIAAAIAATR